ncbi:MAG: sugar ABC transporter substrate-binding protein [Candidatus Avilachnospira sp.]|jgi:ribose transport system substrate-binding protein
MFKKITAIAVGLTMGAMALVGCSNVDTATTTAAATEAGASGETASAQASTGGEKYDIAFIVKSMQSAFFINMTDAAEKCGQDYADKINVEIMAPQTPFNIEEQIQLVEQCITNQVDAIVIAPCDSEGIVPAIEKANAAGIVVVTANTKSNGGDITAYVGVENYDVGYSLATALFDKLGGEGNVILIEGKAGNSTSEERAEGFKAAMENYPGITLLSSQPADWDRASAMTVMENCLQTYDDIDGVLTLTKDMGLGAIEAIKAAGREDEIVSMTFDVDDDVIAALEAGDLYASGNQNEQSQAYIAIMTAVFALDGYKVDDEQILPISVVTLEDFQ